MSFLGSSINSDQSSAGRAAIYIGAGTSPYTSLSSTMYSVGACDGTVSISPNQDIIKLNRSDGQNPYAVLETAYDIQVTFNLQEVDVFNLALACGYNTAAEVAEAFTDNNLANYSSATSGHHGILQSGFTHLTSDDTSSIDAIDQIILTNATNDTLSISVGTDSTVLDGLDATANAQDWVILSGITNPSLTGFNGIPIRLSEGEPGGTADLIIATSTLSNVVGYFESGASGSGFIAGTYTTGLGRLRQVVALDMITYKNVSGVKSVVFDFAEQADTDGFLVGDFISLKGTVIGSGEEVGVASGSASVNLNKEINDYPLRITTVVTGVGASVTCLLPAHTSHTSAVDAVYDSENSVNTIAMGYLDPASQLVLGSDSQANYRSMMIRVEGGQFNNSGDPNYLERQVAEWQFYKCKLAYGGSVDYDRTGAVTYPVVAHCLGNTTDVVGRYITPSEFSRTNYYGDT